jgi:hypothetical protein
MFKKPGIQCNMICLSCLAVCVALQLHVDDAAPGDGPAAATTNSAKCQLPASAADTASAAAAAERAPDPIAEEAIAEQMEIDGPEQHIKHKQQQQQRGDSSGSNIKSMSCSDSAIDTKSDSDNGSDEEAHQQDEPKNLASHEEQPTQQQQRQQLQHEEEQDGAQGPPVTAAAVRRSGQVTATANRQPSAQATAAASKAGALAALAAEQRVPAGAWKEYAVRQVRTLQLHLLQAHSHHTLQL